MSISKITSSSYKEQIDKYLTPHTAYCMFMRNNIYNSGVEYANKPFHGDYYGSFNEHGFLNGVLAHYWNGNIMMQANDLDILSDLVGKFVQTNTREIRGILGEEIQALSVIKQLGIDSLRFAVNYAEDLFSVQLQKLIEPQALIKHDYKILPASKASTSILKNWLAAYHIEALGADGGSPNFVNTIDIDVQNTLISQNRWVLLHEGIPVSLCGFNAEIPEAVQIGPVFTPIEFRNNGYARVLLYLCLQQAKHRQIKEAILFTSDKYASRVYTSLGFEKIGKYRLAILKD